jgi:RNA polymerase sigma-70 factor (ECF subfamily)
VRADLLRRLGRREEAAAAYRDALALVTNEAERRFLERRLAEVAVDRALPHPTTGRRDGT